MKVSIIMACFNREDYIKDCLDSILSQTFMDFELIIIDDNSTDNTVQIIENYNDNRIILIKNDVRKGLTYNLNYAITIAKGEYIARMDDDDICEKNRLITEVKYLDSHKKVDVVCSQALSFGSKSGLSSYIINNNNFIKSFLLFRNVIIHSSVMFRNKFKYNEHFVKAQDFELWSRLVISEQCNFAYINKPLLRYRWHSNQTNVTVQNTFGVEILRRNYNELIKNYNEKFFKIHCSLINYSEFKVSTEDIIAFYSFYCDIFKYKYKYIKIILLFELYNFCKKKGIKYPKGMFIKLILYMFSIRGIRFLYSILRYKVSKK